MRLMPAMRRRPNQIRAQMLRLGAMCLLVAGLAGGVWELDRNGTFSALSETLTAKTHDVTRQTGFRLDDIFVEGRQRTSLDDLRIAVGLDHDAAMLSFSPHHLRERIEALPWVHTAHVERRLPDTLYIRIEERHPLVIWQDEGRFAIVDTTGHIIPASAPEIKALDGLPLVVGEQAPEKAREFLEIVASQPALKGRVKAGIRVGHRRWDIVTDSDIAIQLPEMNPHKAWATLAGYQARHEVLDRDIETIDLRLPDRVVVRLVDPETFRKPLPGQDT